MSTVPNNSFPIVNTTTTGSANALTFSEMNASAAARGITLSNGSGVSTTVTADGNGNLLWGASADRTNSIYKSHVFSKHTLEEKIQEFNAGKYTRRYMEVYLEFMLLNAMLDNLEYLEYKTTLDKGLNK